VSRLRDSQLGDAKVNDIRNYIRRGKLWEAFDADTAPVLLIDEIDKADPDVPNSLLVPLGSQTFTVHETGQVVKADTGRTGKDGKLISPLVIFTSNAERSLPQAFLRRCIVLELPAPSETLLVEVACRHFGKGFPLEPKMLKLSQELAAILMAQREESEREGLRKPGTAEYLDALRACVELEISPVSPEWAIMKQVVMKKDSRQ